MSVSNLTNTTWIWNSTNIDTSANFQYLSLNFTSNSTNYTEFTAHTFNTPEGQAFFILYDSDTVYYDDNGSIAWVNEAYRTFTITGGSNVTNNALITYIEANATQQTATAGVEVTYNNNTIKTQTENGSFTLSCNGKKMTSDVVISATDVQAITVTYNGNTIINGSGTHDYTLSCNGKKMASDVVVNVQITAPIVYPSKGDIITMDLDGTDKQYRVLKVSNTIAEVLSMSDASSQQFASSGQTYENGVLDTYLNTTWYNTLSSTAKSAIVDKTFKQDSWYGGTSGDPDYQGKYSSGSAYQVSLGNASFGNEITRHAYAISIQDVLDYLEVTPQMTQADTTLTYDNVWTMFWNSTTTHNGNIWLRSADVSGGSRAFNVRGNNGNLNANSANGSYAVRPAFQIDLSQVDFTIVPTQSTSTISFTIDGTTYQADENMTWTDWVNSSYNTDGYYVNYNSIEYHSAYGIENVGYIICDSVGTTDAIQANRAYVLFDLGTCSGGGEN